MTLKPIGMFLLFLSISFLFSSIFIEDFTQKDKLENTLENVTIDEINKELQENNFSENISSFQELETLVCNEFGNESQECYSVKNQQSQISENVDQAYQEEKVIGQYTIQDIHNMSRYVILISIPVILIGFLFVYKGSENIRECFRAISKIFFVLAIVSAGSFLFIEKVIDTGLVIEMLSGFIEYQKNISILFLVTSVVLFGLSFIFNDKSNNS